MTRYLTQLVSEKLPCGIRAQTRKEKVVYKTGEELLKSRALLEFDPQTYATIRMDKRVELMSQYVTNKITELSGRSLEVGFMFLGNVERHIYGTTQHSVMDIKDIYIPIEQRITGVTFDFTNAAMADILNYTEKHNLASVAVGHSHGNLSVFHSERDIQNCREQVRLKGGLIRPIEEYVNRPLTHTYNSRPKSAKKRDRRALQQQKMGEKKVAVTQVKRALAEDKKYFPSFVYNTHGHIEREVAYMHGDEFRMIKDVCVEHYNTNVGLTDDEKNFLDRRVYEILAYNNITPAISPQQNIAMRNRSPNVRSLDLKLAA
jgi:hypothetical protein